MKRKVFVMGVGMVKFSKPGESDGYEVMAGLAIRDALKDAGIEFKDLQQAYAGYVYGDSTCGQRAVYTAGITGIPVINVNNNCSTGSTALYMARQAIESGSDCILAVGFEQMEKGALGSKFTDRTHPLDRHIELMTKVQGFTAAPVTAQIFGGAGREYRWQHGTKKETFAKIAEKARAHAARNPLAVFREPLSVEQILASDEIFDPLTKFQCCPPTCGAAAAVICSADFLKKKRVSPKVEIVAQAMTTDFQSTFDDDSMINVCGFQMSSAAADEVYEKSGVAPKDVDVVELHDCFTVNELLSYEALKLCGPGEAEKFIWDKQNTYGGAVVTNPSGGLLSKGHPLGATGLAQCAELTWQLRAQAGERQVPDARIALQHNIGLGGAAIVTMYRAAS